jgi:hypothetical protein
VHLAAMFVTAPESTRLMVLGQKVLLAVSARSGA